ncbi:ArsR/SmtB family transcription factor [Lysinimonas soli]|uniref:ArsR/SmtB family transcription factor n=1 Tax=Lysinimonas soli TaxID=1074233 RepID=A0ABW0NJR6_9MICO
MDTLEALADPVRRRMVQLLSHGASTAGELARAVGDEFAISQPAASRHLRVLREAELVTSQVDGTRRIYRLQRAPFDELDGWLREVRAFWDQRLDALETEVARGVRSKRRTDATPSSQPLTDHEGDR